MYLWYLPIPGKHVPALLGEQLMSQESYPRASREGFRATFLSVLLFSAFCFAFSGVTALAANSVSIGLAESGSETPVDTAYLGTAYEFQVFIENDIENDAK